MNERQNETLEQRRNVAQFYKKCKETSARREDEIKKEFKDNFSKAITVLQVELSRLEKVSNKTTL